MALRFPALNCRESFSGTWVFTACGNFLPMDIRTTDAPEKSMPNSIEAEEAVLGALLIDPDAIIKAAPIVRAEDFY